jgi:hypothetical protein
LGSRKWKPSGAFGAALSSSVRKLESAAPGLYPDTAVSAGEPDLEPARRIALRLALQQLRRELLAPTNAASRKHSG